MAEVRVTRRYRFSSSHRLHSPVLSEGENREVFGKCNNPYGHGHDYTLDVSVTGALDPVKGRLVPLDRLDQLVRQVVLDPMDRRDLNTEVAEFTALVPTTENLAAVIAQRLASAWPIAFPGEAARFEKVRIWETRNNIFEMFAPRAASRPQMQTDAAVGAAKE